MPSDPQPQSPQRAEPMWSQPAADPDLDEARTDPAMASWLAALEEQGQATMKDNREELLYHQAPDALRQTAIDPTETAVEDWVQQQLDSQHT